MLPDLIRQARNRLIWNDLFVHGANAASAGLAAFILLLLVGTQVLDWRLAALIPAGVAIYGVSLAWGRRPDAYAAARAVDHRLFLHDSLSTAVYYDHEDRRALAPESIRVWQYRQAEQLCGSIDPRAAVPFTTPRGGYAALALLLAASSLFALRYGLSRTLDLAPPLARIVHQARGGSDPAKQASGAKKNAPRTPDLLDQMGLSINDRDAVDSLDPAIEEARAQTAGAERDNLSQAQKKSSGKEPGEEGDQISIDEPGEGEEGGSGESGEGQKGAGKSKDGEQSSQQQAGSSEKNSLLEKFREAMRNMMSKMKQQPEGGQQQSQMAQNGKQGKSQQGQGKQSSQGQKQKDGGRDSESPEGEAGEDGEAEQQAQARGAGNNGEQAGDKQPGSGIGKQDGDKDLKLAEQMAAMGKLSEIIGKRSANVTGEAMVEVKNTSQQLSTRYESKRATHGESGAEINRDEVPVALQGYVEQYFEQVRKGEKK